MDCGGCLKYLRNAEECINCTYGMSSNIVNMAAMGAYIPEDDLEEVRFEVFSRIRNEKVEEESRLGYSMLSKFLGNCSDTAVYLSKTRVESKDDFRCIVFEPRKLEAYITNGDVVLRLSDINGEIIYGLCDATPAYDYMSESFIPNPLPWSTDDLAKEFGNEYYWMFTLPIDFILEGVMQRYMDPVTRRSHLAVFDTGYSHPEGTIVIPKFDLSQGYPVFYGANGKPILVSNKSQIPIDMIEPDVSYIGVPDIRDDAIYLDVYKKFGEEVTMGMYKLMPEPLADDLNPFFLEGYSNVDKVKFKLLAGDEDFPSKMDKYNAYRYFEPFALELEFLYETLVLFKSFGYSFVNLCSKGTNSAVVLEGVRMSPEMPMIEAIIAPVIVGNPGHVCETVLERQLVTYGSSGY